MLFLVAFLHRFLYIVTTLNYKTAQKTVSKIAV